MNVGIACGGTGGHLFPGLATARALEARGHTVTLWVSGRNVESISLGNWQGQTVAIPASGFPSGISLQAVKSALSLIRACRRCRARMRDERPDILLAMGSYASVGPVWAASREKVPVVLHEANVIPGRAISFLARRATAVAVTFPETRDYLRHPRIEVTGFPVRQFDITDRPDKGRGTGVPTVLVMGGSQGAHRLNELACDAIIRLVHDDVAIRVIHLAGTSDEELVRQRYKQASVDAEVHGFLREMEEAYRRADFAISRSGAASCAELAACVVPALLVPYPWARRDHQAANARSMVASGGMEMIREEDLTAEKLVEWMARLCKDIEARERMRTLLHSCRVPAGAGRLADLVEQVARR